MSEEKKGLSPLAWIGIGCGVLVVLVVAVVVGLGWWGMHKLKQAGIDPEMWQRHPAQAAAKMIETFNPELEVVEVDDETGTITVRNRKTGETVTLDLDDVREGRIQIEAGTGESGETSATITIGEGGVTIEGEEGTVRIGGGLEHPDWVPLYPGATTAEGGMTNRGDGEVEGLVSQTTPDDPATVARYFEQVLSGNGYQVSTSVNASGGQVASATVTATRDEDGRELHVIVYASGGTTRITLNYAQKPPQE